MRTVPAGVRHRDWIDLARRSVEEAELRGQSGSSAVPPAPRGEVSLPRDFFPGYALEFEIRSGGQGVVYAAVQKSTGRRVALKVLRDWALREPLERARFEREIQVLASLQHPHIVAIFDSGSVAGQFFFVMEFIPGGPLDVHMARRRNSIREALELFAAICEAVDAAHVRGVIHRDIKPANILVDEGGRPRVVDFGLAKLPASETASSEAATLTHTGQFVGSLPWSAPEQFDARATHVDTRSDVYSLGVVLYQVLAGRFPYPVTGPIRGVLDNITSAAPAPLRTQRGDIDDELETIVLKCLSKERERRYQTAGELARDLRRYLANEPIEAKRDSFSYVLRKQLRRHRLPVFAAASFLLLLVAALAATFSLWQQAAEGRTRAEAQSARAATAEAISEKRRLDAEQHLADAEAVASLLEGIFGADAETREFRGGEYTVKQMLDERAEPVLAQIGGRPALEIRLRSVLTNAYRALGEFERAALHGEALVSLTREALGPGHDDYARALKLLGHVHESGGESEKAEPLFREAVAIHERNQNVEGQWSARLALAGLLLERGDLPAAGAFLRDGAGGEPPATLPAKHRIELHHLRGGLSGRQGRLEDAEREYRAALALLEAHARPDDHRGPMLRNDLALVLRARGDLAAARPLLEIAASQYAHLYGEESPRYATVLSNLGLTMGGLGENAAAEPVMRRALEIRRRLLPAGHPDLAAGANNLAFVLEKEHKYAEATSLYREALQLLTSRFGELHPNAVTCAQSLARTLQAAGQAAEALALLQTLADGQRAGSAKRAELASTLALIGMLQNDLGDFPAAEVTLRECAAIRAAVLPADSWLIANTNSVLGEALARQGRTAEAAPLLRESLATLQANPQTPPERLKQAAARLRYLPGE